MWGSNENMRWTGSAALAIVAAFAATPATAQAAKQTYDIPAQGLASALQAFARVSGRELLYSTEVVAGKRSAGLRGSYDPPEALTMLLRGTKLRFRATASGALLVEPQATGEAIAGSAATQNESAEIVVTGTNIRRVTPSSAPATVITRAEIAKTGYATVEDIFDDLPANSREINTDGGFATGVSRVALSNSQNASGISLRGLGPESTLVLLNGKRRPGNVGGRVFDISAIPLAAIERVEVVTGGRSAIYGSDAVAGVVNLVTRRDFEGAETDIYAGTADKGGQRIELSQTVGLQAERGGLVVAYDFARDWRLELKDAGLSGPSPFGVVPGRFDVRPDSKRHSLFAAGHFDLTDGIELYTDLLYTHDRNRSVISYAIPGAFEFAQASDVTSEQYSGVAGAKIDLGSDWQLDVSGTYGEVRNHQRTDTGDSATNRRTNATLAEFSAVADGRLLSIGGRDVRGAFGVAHRRETYRERNVTNGALVGDYGRNISSAFGEVLIPLVDKFEVSAAGRYDRYSDFGDTFNPQVGVSWKPVGGLNLRANWASAFRAPSLLDISLDNQVFLEDIPDPTAASGEATVLTWYGGNAGLRPERAKTWSLGFDYVPDFAPKARISLSYFNIRYRGRIDEPTQSNFTVLLDEANFASLIERAPSQAFADAVLQSALSGRLGDRGLINFTGLPFDPASQNLLTTFPGLIIFDNRRNNIGIDAISGIDLDMRADIPAGDNLFGVRLDGTFYLKGTRRTTPDSPAIQQIDRPGKPADFRLRGQLSWTRGALGLFTYANHVDSYRDTIANPARKVGSWTTFDLTARLDGDKLAAPGLLSKTTLTFSVDNIFDTRPPLFVSNDFGLGYDPANASPTGRYFSVRLNRKW